MCRFWSYRIWLNPILDDYETFMRFDSDSCFTSKLHTHLPGLPSSDQGYAYAANSFKLDGEKVSAGLFATTQKYIEGNKITVKNPALYQMMSGSRPIMVYNNFEVSNITFFRQPHVLNYTRTLAEEEPLGILRTRWGDAPIRTLTLAIFADEADVLWDAQPDGYKHQDACILGKTYNGSQAVAVEKMLQCKHNCLMSYKERVYGLGRPREKKWYYVDAVDGVRQCQHGTEYPGSYSETLLYDSDLHCCEAYGICRTTPFNNSLISMETLDKCVMDINCKLV